MPKILVKYLYPYSKEIKINTLEVLIMDSGCCGGICAKCWSAKYMVLGVIVLANHYWLKWEWAVVIGVLLVLKGIMKLAMPTCGHCKEMPMKKGKR